MILNSDLLTRLDALSPAGWLYTGELFAQVG